LTDEPVLFETEGGLVVLRGSEVLFSQKKGSVSRSENLVIIAEKAKEAGLSYIGTMDASAAEELVKLGVAASQLSEAERDELNSQKLAIMVKSGFAPDEAAAFAMIREMAVTAAEASITETSSREDLQLVHGIQGLDELDKFLNITSERVTEWYGLHFPELQALLGDNVLLCKMVVEVGARENFDEERLQGKGFSDKKIEALVLAAAESKGGTVTERDTNRVVGLAHIALSASAEREKLAEYVESTMKRIAPNITDVAGATIGARLIAKAGGLDRIARLPASTIQVLGAEKALFRALRTGARPPKHGILFQHDAVHTAPKWQRGKIARALANKIAIAARIDYYRGEKEGGLTATLEKRLDEIRVKYKEQPKDSGLGTEGRPPRMRRSSFRGRREETSDTYRKSKRWHKTRPTNSSPRKR
jgi:nucleolar protein 56